MNSILNKVKNIQTEGCVTIVCNTHRSHPENESDALRLKNLVNKVEERLSSNYDAQISKPIMEKLNKVVDEIDHRKNLESLLIFANPNMIEYTRLAITATARVVIDNTFATRDLIRAEHEQQAYYTLVLSRNKARLIEAMNDKSIAEIEGNFPYKNETLHTADSHEKSISDSENRLAKEFFNRVDKEVQIVVKNRPLPVMLVAEERNFEYFMEVADKKEMYMGNLTKSGAGGDVKPHHIIDEVWPEVQVIKRNRNTKRIKELKQAVNNGKVLSDINDIWRATVEGRGRTLFIKKGYYQPGIISGNEIKLVSNLENTHEKICDDIVDEMIEQNISFGGDTIFISGTELDKFQNIALTIRY